MHLHVGYFIYTIVESDSAASRLLRKKIDLCTMIYLIVERFFLKKFPIHLSIYLSIYQMYKCDWVSVLWWSLSLVFVFFRSIFFQFLFYLLSLFSRVLLFTAHSSFRFIGNSSPFQLCTVLHLLVTIAPYFY